MRKFSLAIFLAMLLASCNSIGVFERTTSFPQFSWGNSERPSFMFGISDTSSLYNIDVVLRHTDAYRYNNIWIDLSIIAPGDTAQTQRLKLTLANNTQWLGSEMDDVVEHRVRVNHYPLKLKKGNYQFVLQQIMRDDPLQNVMSVGVRIEKAVQ